LTEKQFAEWRLVKLSFEIAALANSLGETVLSCLAGATACEAGDRFGISRSALDDLERQAQARVCRKEMISRPRERLVALRKPR
jgi:hypothetical protein